MSSRCPYEVLEVSPGASFPEIRRAYERVRAIFGPSSLAVYSLVTPEEQRAVLMEIEEAYRILADPELRRTHDEEHGHPPPEVKSAPSVEAVRALVPTASAEARAEVESVPGAAAVPAGMAAEPSRWLTVEPARPALAGERSLTPSTGSVPLAEHPGPAFTDSVPAVKRATVPASRPIPAAERPLAASTRPAPAVEHPPATGRAPVGYGAPTGTTREAVEEPGLAARPAPAPARTGLRPTPPPLPSTPQMPAPPMPEITPDTVFTGALLREVRMARRLTIQDLSHRTKISPMHLESLEKERWDWLPARVFVRGFLVSVARELGLDPEQVARTFLARRERGG